MKYLLSVICCLFSVCCFSQLVGYTKKQIRESKPNETFVVTYPNGMKAISIHSESEVLVYFINKAGICIIENAIILSSENLKKAIELYNEKFIRIDDTHWKIYNIGRPVIDCALLYNEKNKFYYFNFLQSN